MYYTVPPLLSAPLVTDHPLGLPGARPDRQDTRVKPIADARDPRAELRDGKPPAKFWRAVNGKPDPDRHAAPPSIMQITISRMLDEQRPEREAAAQAAEASQEAETRAEAAPSADPSAEEDAQAASKEARSSVFSTLP